MSLRNIWNKWTHNEDGNFAIMGAIAVLALVLMTGFATDTQYLVNKQQRLQSASDAIVLQAFQSGERSPAELQTIAQDYINNAFSEAERNQVQVADIRRVGDEVRVVLAQNLENDSGFFLRRPNAAVSAEATASNAGEQINISLVLDTTGSMGQRGRIQALKRAANAFIDQLEKVDNDSFRVAIVPFAQYVNIGENNINASWVVPPTNNSLRGCVGSRLGPQALRPEFAGDPFTAVTVNEGRDSCGTELLPLTRDLDSVRRKVNSLQTRGFTYLPAGLIWGWRTLEPSLPFTEAQATIRNGKEPRKVMIFMTDGANTVQQNGNIHQITGRATFPANQQTTNLCNDAKASDVEIYTVALQITDTPTLNLVSNCASSMAQSFDAQNEAELVSAFEQIGRELGRLRLTN